VPAATPQFVVLRSGAQTVWVAFFIKIDLLCEHSHRTVYSKFIGPEILLDVNILPDDHTGS
jgi:hypothetical protein